MSTKVILRILFVYVLPPLFMTVGKTDLADGFLEKLEVGCLELADKKLILFFLGLFVSGIIIPYDSFVLKQRVNRYQKLVDTELIPTLKSSYDSYLQSLLSCGFEYTSIRLFLPKSKLHYLLHKTIKRRLVLKHVEIPGLHTEKLKDKLEFLVYPENKSQGLLGKSYIEREINMMTSRNDVNGSSYSHYYERMSQHQKIVADKHNFVLTVPIIDSNDRIVGIMSIDSKKTLDARYRSRADLLTLSQFAKDIYRIFLNSPKIH